MDALIKHQLLAFIREFTSRVINLFSPDSRCIICQCDADSFHYLCNDCFYHLPTLVRIELFDGPTTNKDNRHREPQARQTLPSSNIIFNHLCLTCANLINENSSSDLIHCSDCISQSIKTKTINTSKIYFRYQFPISFWLQQYKFHKQYFYATLLADLFVYYYHQDERQKSSSEKFHSDIDVITAIPSHPKRIMEHGFNHSQLLAKQISQRLDIPYKRLFIRHQHAKPVSGLKAKARKRYIKNSFICNIGLGKYQKIALVDDIYTTGSTSQEAARTLKQQNPSLDIEIWAIAKTLRN